MKKLLSAAIIILFLVFPFTAFGLTTFSNIVSFGDSLTDNDGYVYGTSSDSTDIHGFGYYTNGDVWVELLASTMGSTLYDVAYGGATTGYDNPAAGVPFTGLQWQVDNAVPAISNWDDTLITVWAGANDFFQGGDFSVAAANVGTALNKLGAYGPTSILVPNLPDIGLTPGFYNDANPYVTTAQATAWTQAFNNQLFGVIETFANENASVNVYYIDTYTIFSDLILMENGEINALYWDLLFWDDVHPTSLGHSIIAGEAYAALQTAVVPEPTTMLLLGTGLLGLAGAGRKKLLKR